MAAFYFLLAYLAFYLEDGSGMFLRNIDELLPVYIVSRFRR
jgi:hypothetical protein